MGHPFHGAEKTFWLAINWVFFWGERDTRIFKNVFSTYDSFLELFYFILCIGLNIYIHLGIIVYLL